MVILFAIHSSTVVLASVLMMLSGDSLPLNLTFISRMHITVSVMMVIAQILLIGGGLLIQVRDKGHSVRVLNVLHVSLFSELW